MNRSFRTGLLAAAVAACCAAPAFAAEPAVVAEPGTTDGALISSERLIVTYKDPALSPALKLSTVNAAARRARAARVGVQAAGARTTAAPTASVQRRLGTGAELLRLSQRVSASEMHAIVAEVAADPAVASVQVDRLYRHTGMVAPQLVPNDPFYAQYQWHMKASPGGANVEPARDLASGNGVIVAVLDTGITAHPDLDANMLPGYDFITDPFVSRRVDNTRVPGAADLGDWAAAGDCGAGEPAEDSSWHGTHVAGTVAQLSNNGLGMAGVASAAKVLPVRVLGRCGGYTSDIADAITWASGGTVAGVPTLAPSETAEIINMSLGGGGSCNPVTQAAIDGAVSRGVLVVVAAGNSNGPVANFSPASCNNVVSVGAARVTGGRASYSNYGALVDIAAPGGGGGVDGNPDGYVWQAINAGATVPTTATYGGMGGTSMAAPHVAGVAALVQSVAPTPLTPAAMEILLKENVRAFPAAPDQVIGTGLLDATLAVTAATTPPGEQPAIPLTSKVAVTNVSGAAGGTRLYAITVPGGVRLLNLMTYGGSGDVSLYASRDTRPTTSVSQWRSVRPGNNETIRISNPVAGTYYMLVSGVTNYAGLSVQARID